MVDQTVEAVRPVARDPIDHVATIGCAQRTHSISVQERVAFLGRLQALLKVFERFATPVTGDRVRERLAVARRTMKIDGDDRVTGGSVGLRIPTVVKIVVE